MKKECHHTYADQHEAHYAYPCSACAKELVLALADYVTLNALEHDDPDCPQDDTCDCAVTRRLSNALDAALAADEEKKP